jgi:hypothetical protein
MDVLGNPAPPARCRPQKLLNEANAMARKAEADLAFKIATAAQKEIDAEEAANNPAVEEPKAKPKAKAKAKKK